MSAGLQFLAQHILLHLETRPKQVYLLMIKPNAKNQYIKSNCLGASFERETLLKKMTTIIINELHFYQNPELLHLFPEIPENTMFYSIDNPYVNANEMHQRLLDFMKSKAKQIYGFDNENHFLIGQGHPIYEIIHLEIE